MKHRFLSWLAAGFLLAGCTGAPEPEKQPEVKEETEEVVEEETVTVKENADYFAPAAPTKYIAETYDALSASLEQDDRAQAEAAARYFLADFFTLSNKDSENDIGGLDLIPSSSAEDFKEYAAYYYYNNLPEIMAHDGKSALPSVTGVTLSEPEETTVEYMDEEYPGYTFDVTLAYKDSPQASQFKTSARCTIIKMSDVHFVDRAAVTSEREAGEPKDVWRIIAVTD